MSDLRFKDLTDKHVGATIYWVTPFKVEKFILASISPGKVSIQWWNEELGEFQEWSSEVKDKDGWWAEAILYLDEHFAQEGHETLLRYFKESIATPDKFLKFVFDRCINPNVGERYYEIVGDTALEEEEAKVVYEMGKQLFGIDLTPPSE